MLVFEGESDFIIYDILLSYGGPYASFTGSSNCLDSFLNLYESGKFNFI